MKIQEAVVISMSYCQGGAEIQERNLHRVYFRLRAHRQCCWHRKAWTQIVLF